MVQADQDDKESAEWWNKATTIFHMRWAIHEAHHAQADMQSDEKPEGYNLEDIQSAMVARNHIVQDMMSYCRSIKHYMRNRGAFAGLIRGN